MILAIFGGTGETGNILVHKALDAGHIVRVFARNPSNLHVIHPNVSVIRAYLHDKQAIEDTIDGCDAVISVLGPNEMSDSNPIAEGIRNIVTAMEKLGVRRLIATTTPSAADPKDRFDFMFHVNDMIIKVMMKNVYTDSLRSAETIRNSNLDWTIVRVPFLSNKPSGKKVVTGYLGDRNLKLFFLSRTDLAKFLLTQLEDRKFLQQMPVLSN